jgi:formate hydrogenlyase subunit 3/multisubunit Na+/H+ antiporter MnhD subunit
MTIIGGVYGVFLSRDAFLLFVFYEIVILPKYMLIAIWGSTNKEYGAMKLTMYSIGASALILIGLVAAYAAAGATSFDIAHLAAPVSAGDAGLGVSRVVSRFRGAGGHVAVPHLGTHRPRGRAHRRVDAAGRRGDETRCLRRACAWRCRLFPAGIRVLEGR